MWLAASPARRSSWRSTRTKPDLCSCVGEDVLSTQWVMSVSGTRLLWHFLVETEEFSWNVSVLGNTSPRSHRCRHRNGSARLFRGVLWAFFSCWRRKRQWDGHLQTHLKAQNRSRPSFAQRNPRPTSCGCDWVNNDHIFFVWTCNNGPVGGGASHITTNVKWLPERRSAQIFHKPSAVCDSKWSRDRFSLMTHE